ncbi:hypothetical protein D3C85_1462290 [compost metagenome]
MRGSINTQRQTTGDDETGAGQAAGKRGGRVHPRKRGASATDHRQLRFFQNAGIARYE